MKGIFNKTLKVLGQAFESLLPDDEAARRIGERYARIFYPDTDSRK